MGAAAFRFQEQTLLVLGKVGLLVLNFSFHGLAKMGFKIGTFKLRLFSTLGFFLVNFFIKVDLCIILLSELVGIKLLQRNCLIFGTMASYYLIRILLAIMNRQIYFCS